MIRPECKRQAPEAFRPRRGQVSEQIGDEPGAVVIADAEDLQDAGIRQEGAGALPISSSPKATTSDWRISHVSRRSASVTSRCLADTPSRPPNS